MDRKMYLQVGMVMSAASLWLIGFVQAAPVIVNGDFETTPLETFFSIPGWTQINVNGSGSITGPYIAGTGTGPYQYADNGKPTTQNAVGTMSILKKDYTNLYFCDLYQDVSGFTVGGQYILSYELNADYGPIIPGGQRAVEVQPINYKALIGGVVVASQMNVLPVDALDSHDVLYNQITVPFTATAETLEIKFTAYDSISFFEPGYNRNLLLDNVVILVPNSGIPGDYNNNSVVDAADYVLWRKNNNTAITLPNDSTSGTDPTDYDVWRAHFGQVPGSGSASANAAVPEPATLVLLMFAAAGWCLWRRRRTA